MKQIKRFIYQYLNFFSNYLPKPLQWILWGTLSTLFAIASVGVVLNLPPVTRFLGETFAQYVEEKTGLSVSCEKARLGFWGISAQNLHIRKDELNRLHLDKLRIYPDMVALLRGLPRIRAVVGDGFEITIPYKSKKTDKKDEDPKEKKQDFLKKIEKITKYLNSQGVISTFSNGKVNLLGMNSNIISMPLNNITAKWQKPGSYPIDLSATIGSSNPQESLTIATSFSPNNNDITFDVFGEGIPLEPYRSSIPYIFEGKELEKIEKYIKIFPNLPKIGGKFVIKYDKELKSLVVNGKTTAMGVYISHESIASMVLGPFDFVQDLYLTVYKDPLQIYIDKWNGFVNKVKYNASFNFDDTKKGPEISSTLLLNQVSYQDVIDSIPTEAKTTIDGIQVGGVMDIKLHLEGNLNDLKNLETDFQWNWGNLSLIKPSAVLSGGDPLQGFRYKPYTVDGANYEFTLGRSEPGWITIDQLPKHVVHSLLLSEDINFFKHQGFDSEGLKKALQVNLKAGKAIRGGSTITQQLAKNLFLTRERTALRKILEAILAWELEKVFSKEDILEYYFNIIEWGPGIYGIGKASDHYYGKHPSELTIKEGAYLCTIIPNPIRYHLYFERGSLTERWNNKLQQLLDRMYYFHFLSEEEYLYTTMGPLAFRGSPKKFVDISEMEEVDSAEQDNIESIQKEIELSSKGDANTTLDEGNSATLQDKKLNNRTPSDNENQPAKQIEKTREQNLSDKNPVQE